MKYGKRQLILASLILALGAAVYLNWQFTGAETKINDTAQENSETLGAAQLVNSSYVETVSDTMEDLETANGSVEETVIHDFEAENVGAAAVLSDARMTRQTARDEAVELLEDILEDAQADTAVKEAAISEASVIAQNILKETNVESLIQAKGFTECVAYINGDSCTVVVNGDMENEQNALIVREIAVTETGLSAEKIKIIPAS
ncbi:MAG: SpoIIIAH-like family protein [Clostridia bacterium]|nr:SpoIIIAH-like family protein [Clostridia bacterium]